MTVYRDTCKLCGEIIPIPALFRQQGLTDPRKTHLETIHGLDNPPHFIRDYFIDIGIKEKWKRQKTCANNPNVNYDNLNSTYSSRICLQNPCYRTDVRTGGKL